MVRTLGVMTCLVAGFALSGLTGCDTGTSSATGAVDAAAAVTKLAGLATEVKAAFEGGDPHDAHDQLHVIPEVLDQLVDAAKAAGLSEANQSKVLEAVESLFEQFSKLDEGMHGGEQIGYDAVGPQIDSALNSLKELLGG